MRTCKTGLDYFPFDVDFFEDPKVEFIAAKYDIIGENVCIKLLCRVYRNGYFLPWGEDEALLFAKRSGNQITFEMVNGIVEEMLKRGFFSRKHFDTYGILTSNGIQKRYLRATERRKDISMIREFIIADIKGFNVNILPIDSCVGTQSKVKESKESKESKKDFLSNSDEFRLSALLLSLILERNPEHKKPNLQTWAKEIDFMIRIDGRLPQKIEDVIKWCQKDSFWFKNILSTKKLRDKFDQLVLKMNGKPKETCKPKHSDHYDPSVGEFL